MESPLMQSGNIVPREEALFTSSLTMQDFFVNLLPWALVATFSSSVGVPALTSFTQDATMVSSVPVALRVSFSSRLISPFISLPQSFRLVENAGSMHNDHFRFIRACLGLRHLQRSDMTWCTSTISPA